MVKYRCYFELVKYLLKNYLFLFIGNPKKYLKAILTFRSDSLPWLQRYQELHSDHFMVYLKPNVVIEPLYKRWYAWPHLISPVTAVLNVTGRHIKIMESYIQAPQIHANAIRNQRMRGGPFMDHDPSRVDEVIDLLDHTRRDQNELIQFSDNIKSFDKTLRQQAKGYGLKSIYNLIPERLRGYAELVYDLNDNVSIRFFESLLYASPFYQTSAQSISMWLTDNDERPFVLSTPRLGETNVLDLNIPFSDAFIDQLGKMKRTSHPFKEIRDMIEVPENKEELFNTFFTEIPPPAYSKYLGDKVRMRYFGHACILIETKNISILLDPLVSYYGYPQELDRFSDMDLPDKIDYVLITHNHQDHILLETLLPLRHKIGHIIVPKTSNGAIQDPSLKMMFNHIGFKNVFEIGEMQRIESDLCVITGLPFVGEHCDLNIQSKTCYHVAVEKFSMLFMADSCNIEPRVYEHVAGVIGRTDVVFLGMECEGAPLTWLYGPLLSDEIAREKDETRRLNGSNFQQGRAIVETFRPKEVYVYAMGQEPWLEFISSIKYTPESHPITQSNMLIEYCEKKGMTAERLFGEKEILYSKT